MNQWYVYLIESESGKFYAGITTDIDRRFLEHLSGIGGAKFFRGDPPNKLLYVENAKNRSHASQREYQIKKMKRSQKEFLLGLSQN